jgi:hypothetical protein
VKYWEIIADNLSKAGWSWGCVSGHNALEICELRRRDRGYGVGFGVGVGVSARVLAAADTVCLTAGLPRT